MTPLVEGRAAFAARSWGEAYRKLADADQETSLELDDLEQLARLYSCLVTTGPRPMHRPGLIMKHRGAATGSGRHGLEYPSSRA